MKSNKYQNQIVNCDKYIKPILLIKNKFYFCYCDVIIVGQTV